MPLLEEAASGASGLAAAKSKLLSKVSCDRLIMTPKNFRFVFLCFGGVLFLFLSRGSSLKNCSSPDWIYGEYFPRIVWVCFQNLRKIIFS